MKLNTYPTLAFVSFTLVLSIQIIAADANDDQNVTAVVKTNSGDVVGIVKQYGEALVDQYLGIPYAEPPVGELRFRKPKPVTPWEGVLNATSYKSSCMQSSVTRQISEDCLHLNVFVPDGSDGSNGNNEDEIDGEMIEAKAEEPNKDVPKAVMIWIHGGGYVAGDGFVDASYLALKGSVIIVTINYRLGLLGFLSTGDDSSPGNYGLYDQVLAIKWVYDNIEYFGGDKESICIFGESAGGYSVGLNMIIEENKGIVKRALCESGTTTSPRAIAVDVELVANRTAELLGCPTENDKQALVNCLRTVPSEDIIKVQSDALKVPVSPDFRMRIGPVIDGELIKDDPVKLITNKDTESYKLFSSLDILVGSNDYDGSLMYGTLQYLQLRYDYNISNGVPRDVVCTAVSQRAVRSYFNDNRTIDKAICKQYGGDGELSEVELGQNALFLHGDLHFMIPSVQTLEHHAASRNGGSSYHYIFTHKPSYSHSNRAAWVDGASHAEELGFVFGLDVYYPSSQTPPQEEIELADQMMTYWTNFAKTGNPNGASSSANSLPDWPAYKTGDKGFMKLNITPQAGHHLYKQRVEFWNKYMHNVLWTNGESGTTSKGSRIEVPGVLLTFLICLRYVCW